MLIITNGVIRVHNFCPLGFPASGISLIISEEQKMKIRLSQSKKCKKVIKVEAKSDGGISVYPNNSKCFYPIFSVEVSLSSSHIALTLG
jgi:hypothetical protein